MKILVCDDKQEQLNKITENIKSYVIAHPKYAFEVETFCNAFDLLDSLEKSADADVLLLDVCMPGMLGTELAHEILEHKNLAVDIVFLTTSPEFAVEAYSLHATDYLLKPFTQEQFNKMFDRIIKKRSQYNYVPIMCGNEVYRINVLELLYVESMNNDKFIHLTTGECITMRITMPKLYELLSVETGLVEIGVSYIVNFRHVRKFLAATLVLDDGTTITVPRRLRTQLQKEYFEFYTKEVLAK